MFTDDTGSFVFQTRDAPRLLEQQAGEAGFIGACVNAHRARIHRLGPGPLSLPESEAHIDSHNIWCANKPGGLLVIHVLDLSQHLLGALRMLVENGKCVYDNLRNRPI